MELREFGKTGIRVSVLGFGAGNIGDPATPENDIARLLHSVLDSGIKLIDSARSYGLSEERIGRHLKDKRNQLVISTKVGYGIPGYEDWTGPCITAGIDAALERFQTDYIDIVNLHSCPLSVLQREDILEALHRGLQDGKIRAAGYAGDNEALEWAITSQRFGSIEASINICDQRAIDRALPVATERGLGVIAKRPLANAAWRDPLPSSADMATRTYHDRWNAMDFRAIELPPDELALRFAAFLPGVHSCLIGTTNIDHLQHNVEILNRGPLPAEIHSTIRKAFQQNGSSWPSQI